MMGGLTEDSILRGVCGGVVVDHQTPNQEVLGSISTSGTMLCP